MGEKIPVIETFLNAWKEKAFEYYTEQRAVYLVERDKKHEVTKENVASILKNYWSNERRYTEEQVERIMAEVNSGEMHPHDRHNFSASINSSKLKEWENEKSKAEIAILEGMWDKDLLPKVLNKEVDLKRKNLFKRIEKIAGKILDASNLSIGVNGEINGTIEGSECAVNINTIYAGGYNIQCLHYRVLIKEIKTKP